MAHRVGEGSARPPGEARAHRNFTAITLTSMFILSSLTGLILFDVVEAGGQGGGVDPAAADILLVGNSYTQNNNLDNVLSNVIQGANEPSNTSRLAGGGMRLDQHADRMNTAGDQWNTTLQNGELDWVVFQDQSQVPGFPRTSQYWQDSLAGLHDLDDRVESLGGESVLFMTWGYREGDSSNALRYPDYTTMQNHLRDGYIDYSDNVTSAERPVWVAPVGLAYRHIYDGIISEGENPLDSNSMFYNLYSNDGQHPSLRGSYLTSCVMYSTIYGHPTAGQSDTVNLDLSTKFELQQAADATVFNDTNSLLIYPWQSNAWEGPGDQIEDNNSGNQSGNGTGNETGGGEGNGTGNQSSPGEPHLLFGAQSGSTFLVDAGTHLNLMVNITNNGSVEDVANLSVSSTNNWNVSWQLFGPVSGAPMTLSPGVLEWVPFQISIPAVTDGSPLAGIPHHWSLRAISELDGTISWWNFSIEVRQFHRVALVDVGGDLILNPGEDGRIAVTVRNTGNIPTRAVVELQILSGGEPDLSHPRDDRIEANGWTIALFNSHTLEWLNVGEEKEFEVGLLAPDLTAGEISVRVYVRSAWGLEPEVSEDVNASVDWIRDGYISRIGLDCVRTAPNQVCSGSLAVLNLGNYVDDFHLELLSSPTWVSGIIQSSELHVIKGAGSSPVELNILVQDGTLAFSVGEIIYALRLDDTQTIVDTISIPIEVSPVVNWILTETAVEVEEGVLSVAYELVNTGNGPDGLTVVMSASHAGEQGIIPPDNATWEGPEEGLRSFDVRNVSIGVPYHFRTYINVPANEPHNGTVYLNISIRSFLDPAVDIKHSANSSFLGLPWQEQVAEEEAWLNWAAMRLSVYNFWNGYGYTLLAIMLASVAIHLALKRRLRLDAEQKEREDAFAGAQPKEDPKEWLDKFENGGEQMPKAIESPEMESGAFVAAFRYEGGQPKPSPNPVSTELVGAATGVLDHHDEERLREELDSLAGGIETTTSAKHPANVALPTAEAVTSRTQRKDPRGMVTETKNVPLPEEEDEDVELDL